MKYDIAIIGGGPAGYTAAERGSRGKGVRAEETGRKAGGAEGEDEAA